MASTRDGGREGLMPCVFPVGALPDSYKITTKTSDTVRLPSQNSGDARQLFFATWAILLRSYTGNDYVAFHCVGVEAAQQNGTTSCESDKWVPNDPCTLLYEIQDDFPIHQLRPFQSRPSASGLREMNTAVKYSFDENTPFNASNTPSSVGFDPAVSCF